MSDIRTPHDELLEMAALYALGALDAAAKKAFEAHLVSCAECAAEVRALRPVAGALAFAVPQVDPPAALRKTVLSSVTGGAETRAIVPPASPRGSFMPWLAAAACLLAAVGLGIYSFQLRSQLISLSQELGQARARIELTEREVATTRRAVVEAQTAVFVISAPDLRRSDLAGQAPVAPTAFARAFWSQSRGLVFAAANLPPLPLGRTYQLWIVPASGAPVSAGLFEPDRNGRVQAIVTTPVQAAQAAAMALTIEPAGGVPAPTGAKYLVGTVTGL